MLLESQARKMQIYQKGRELEKQEVMELKKALNQEKMDKAERKRVEREAALKVIAENEEDREKRAVQKVQDRILAQKMLADEE